MSANSWWLAEQAPRQIRSIWTASRNVVYERRLWLSVLAFHQSHGVATDPAAYDAYKSVIYDVDLHSIRQREKITRHDVKARIEEYNSLAGFELIHLGMTSADIVDNIAQVKMRDTVLELVALDPIQMAPCVSLLSRWPFRGIKGAVGTMQDQEDLLGSTEAAFELDRHVAAEFGFERVLGSVGQVYPRSLDLDLVATVFSCVAGIPSPFQPVLAGYLSMAAGYAGETWNEGDVSTSVIRRVCLPGALFAAGAVLTGST